MSKPISTHFNFKVGIVGVKIEDNNKETKRKDTHYSATERGLQVPGTLPQHYVIIQLYFD